MEERRTEEEEAEEGEFTAFRDASAAMAAANPGDASWGISSGVMPVALCGAEGALP